MIKITGLFLANLVEAPMCRERHIFQHSNTQGYPLREHIALHHPLLELADLIDWGAIDRVATKSV
jgi:IS5 family transposase